MGRPVVKEFEDEFFIRHALVLDTFTDDAHSEVFEEAAGISKYKARRVEAERAGRTLADETKGKNDRVALGLIGSGDIANANIGAAKALFFDRQYAEALGEFGRAEEKLEAIPYDIALKSRLAEIKALARKTRDEQAEVQHRGKRRGEREAAVLQREVCARLLEHLDLDRVPRNHAEDLGEDALRLDPGFRLGRVDRLALELLALCDDLGAARFRLGHHVGDPLLGAGAEHRRADRDLQAELQEHG